MKHKTIKICDVTALRDRNGKHLTDGKGRPKYLSGTASFWINITPNTDADGNSSDYSLYMTMLQCNLLENADCLDRMVETPDEAVVAEKSSRKPTGRKKNGEV